MSGGAEIRAPSGLIGRIRASYWDFSGAAKRLIAERPSESTLLSFLMVALLMHAFGGVIEMTARFDPAEPPPPDLVQEGLMGVLVTRFLVAALAVYLVAALLTPICRAFGGTGGHYESRAALVWGVLVSAPAIFLQSVVSALGTVAARELSQDAFAWASIGGFAVETVLLALAFVIWAGCIAGAHGFRSQTRVLGVMLAAAIGLAGILWGLTRIL